MCGLRVYGAWRKARCMCFQSAALARVWILRSRGVFLQNSHLICQWFYCVNIWTIGWNLRMEKAYLGEVVSTTCSLNVQPWLCFSKRIVYLDALIAKKQIGFVKSSVGLADPTRCFAIPLAECELHYQFPNTSVRNNLIIKGNPTTCNS